MFRVTNTVMDRSIKSGIGKRVVFSILIVGILPFLAGLYIAYKDGTTTRKNSIGASFQEMATETARKIDMAIKKEVVDVQRFAIAPDITGILQDRGYDKARVESYIKQFVGFDEKDLYSLVIVNTGGGYVAGLRETPGKSYGNEKWFKEVMSKNKSRAYVGDIGLDDASGEHLMSIAAPVMEDGRIIGVVAFKYRLDQLLEVITNVKIEETGHANLVDSSGTIIMCPFYPLRSHHVDSDLVKTIMAPNPGWGIAKEDAHGGVNSIIGFAPVESTRHPEKGWFDGNRWAVFIRQSPKEVYAPIYALLFRISIFGAVLITIIAFAGVYAARKIVRPINELYKGVGLIGEGNLDYRLNIKTNDEIEKLAGEFNQMASKLQESYSALENRNADLAVSEGRYKDLIENSPEMIHSVNADRYFVGVNKTELDILGYTLEEMRNKRIEDIMPDEFKGKGIVHIERARKDGISTVETQFITKGDMRIDVEITATALYHPISGNFVNTRAFVRDITDRKKLERRLQEYFEMLEQRVSDRTRELKETKDYLENLFESANDLIYRLDTSGVITYVNKKVEDWGYRKEDLLGHSFLDVLAKGHKGERFRKTIQEGTRQTYEVEAVDKTGDVRHAILSISPIRNNDGVIVEVLGIAKDITEQKGFEQQISHTEKMSAVGQLAAGIAHEINNPLGGMLNCLYNLRKKRFSQEKEESYYKAMEDGIHRVKKIVSQLLEFSQQHKPEFTPVNINQMVEEVLFLLNYALTKNGINIHKSFDSTLPVFMLDRHQMAQVLTNILLNSVQALKEGGDIRISTERQDSWCRIDISDTGNGIPANVLPKIFDPFFTTKDVGEGTGLGLSVSKGILDMHNGKIEVKSQVGKGTTFTIRLPLTGSVNRFDHEGCGHIV